VSNDAVRPGLVDAEQLTPPPAAADFAASDAGSVSRPPTAWEKMGDRAFRGLSHAFAWLTALLVLFIVFEIGGASLPAMKKYGLGFITGTTWDPNTQQYGILPEIWGTLYSSVLALIVGTILGVAVAVFLSEGFLASFVFRVLKLVGVQFHPILGKLPDQLQSLLRNLIELLAAIPSVVYGLWGIFVIIPLIRPWCDWSFHHMRWIPWFGTELGDKGMLPAALVLAIMILPTISAISRDALVAVPPKLREAAYGLGATRWEAIIAVILPTARTGIIGSVILAFGRALGETMALAMLVGSSNRISWSLFSPANTLAALLANNFPEANKATVPVLMLAALVLMAITLVVNVIGAAVLQQTSRGAKGAR
jgi:phosphate transport system permease protein